MKIGIIGTGYVGLVTGACFSEFGLSVTCMDKDAAKVRSLRRGRMPFYEPGLKDLVIKNSKKGRLCFSTSFSKAVSTADVVFITVGTPPRGDGTADLSYVKGVALDVARHLEGYTVIVTRSTVPVGTGRKVARIIKAELKKRSEKRKSGSVTLNSGIATFDIASNPEFLREGSAIEDFMRPDRVVLGTQTSRAAQVLKDLYKPLFLIDTPFVITDIETAELIKYTANSYLATKISFINEIANLAEPLGVDVHTVAKAIGLDRRIGSKFLHPGPGFGGSCLPKDTAALIKMADAKGVELGVIKAAREANETQRALMLNKISNAMGTVKGKTVAVLGLSFKPNTDDMREAPSIYIIKKLLAKKALVRAYDPAAIEAARPLMPTVKFATSPYAAVRGAHAAVLVTEWNELRNLELDKIIKLMKRPLFFDLRNVYDPARMRQAGFEYHCVGRP